jgi:glycosyltransferase involved in cell wall biosynthesis
MPKISVVVPVYNAEIYLKQCIDSLLAQTFKDIEIIVIDDGSTDGSLSILEKYSNIDDRIKVISQENGGAGKARNTGMDVAKGEFLSFLDADDFFEPSMLEEAYNNAITYNTDISAYQCDLYMEVNDCFTYESRTLQIKHLPINIPFNYTHASFNVFFVFMGWAWDKLFKSEFIKKHNLRFQEQRTTNDLFFVYSAIVLAERIAVIPKILVHQRIDARDSLSKTRDKSWDNFYKALLALRETLHKNGIYDKLEKDYINYAFNFTLWNYRTLFPHTQKMLAEALRSSWFQDLGIKGKKMPYFLDNNSREDYALYQMILRGLI